VIIVKEVPSHCCWFVAPLAWTGVPLTEAGRFRRGVPVGTSVPLASVLEGCWELEEELEWEEGEGLPLDVAKLIKVSLADRVKALLLPLREFMIRKLGKF
jgi:hypothetical protein